MLSVVRGTVLLPPDSAGYFILLKSNILKLIVQNQYVIVLFKKNAVPEPFLSPKKPSFRGYSDVFLKMQFRSSGAVPAVGHGW